MESSIYGTDGQEINVNVYVNQPYHEDYIDLVQDCYTIIVLVFLILLLCFIDKCLNALGVW